MTPFLKSARGFCLASAAMLCLLPRAAWADAGVSGHRCEDIGSDAEVKLAEFTGRDGAHLKWNPDYNAACPGPSPKCDLPDGALTHGQTLLVEGQPYKNYVCAIGVNPRGYQQLGWLDLASVKIAGSPDAHPPLSAWVGTYGNADEYITIRRDGDRLTVRGKTYWPGKNYVPGPRMPDQQIGAFTFSGRPQGNLLRLGGPSRDDAGCWVDIRLVAPFVRLDSGHGCGGINNVFRDVLRRRK